MRNIGHYGCHGVRELASVGDQLQRNTPPGTYCIEEFAKDNRLIDTWRIEMKFAFPGPRQLRVAVVVVKLLTDRLSGKLFHGLMI